MTLLIDPETEEWWARSVASTARELQTDATVGLSRAESAARLATYGPNEIPEEPPVPGWRMLVRQLTGAVVLVLFGAAAVALAIGDLKDALVIAAIIVLDAIVGFVQERRAQHAVRSLRRMTSPFARVVRDGESSTVDATELVLGDLIELEMGDVVPADARLVEAPNLRVSESALTGESSPVSKRTLPISVASGEELAERSNMVFKGTEVSYGRARALVTATGMQTNLGRVALLLQAHQAPATPLQRRLGVLGRQISIATVAVCAVVFVVGIAQGEQTSRMLLASVSLAVAAIPEALPAVVTISLALGALRMARQNAVVRKLPAVETLGSVTVIASDKTGTLTEGRMVVERLWLAMGTEYTVSGSGYEPAGDLVAVGDEAGTSTDLSSLLRVASLCNDAALVAPRSPGGTWAAAGDPMEAALLALVAKAGVSVDELRQLHRRIGEEPFDAARKMMTTFHASRRGRVDVCLKGAVEVVTDDPEAHRQSRRYAEKGYRVLGFAGASYPSLEAAQLAEPRDLSFYGIVAVADPPRPEVADAIAAARRAGIKTVMITGDHPATAKAIAARLGILADGEVVTGAQLNALAPAELAARVDGIAVYARTTPEQKLAIVRGLKDAGHIVAMTGDGVNDAPALRVADIGVAMGRSGTDVAKEAADMVLADDNYATIVVATREGRRIYDNIRRFVRYGLTGGSAEIWVMFLAPFLGLPLPLVPVQILWLNLLTHGLPGLALGVERPDPNSMRRPPRSPRENILGDGLWQHVLVFGLLTASVTLAVAVLAYERGWPWQTMLLTTLVGLQLGNAIAVRSETMTTATLGLTTNRFLLGAIIATIAAQMFVVYSPPMQRLLETDALGWRQLALVVAAATLSFCAIEADKLRRQWRRSSASQALLA